MVSMFFAVCLTSIFCTVVISERITIILIAVLAFQAFPVFTVLPDETVETELKETKEKQEERKEREEKLEIRERWVHKVPGGVDGIDGVDGSKGSKGNFGGFSPVNWKQCVWDRQDNKDVGLIQECGFKKNAANSSLRVAYAGNLRVFCGSSSDCCSRWYFTFNGAQCSGPMTIEGLVYAKGIGNNVVRHRQIEGYCENIPAGHIGNCARWRSTTYDGVTGWMSTSRIMIEETPPPQT